jgi:hypothetical protein
MNRRTLGWTLAIAVAAIAPLYAVANYNATPGAGLSFGSIVIGGVHFPSFLACDKTTANQCQTVQTNGAAMVDAGTAAATTPVNVTLTGTNNINNVTGTVSLPTGAATAANQTNASQKTQIVDGSGNVIASTSNALNVDVTNANANGQATMANSSPVVIASNQSNLPANVAQVGGASLALGQTTMSASVPVALASNQTNLPINGAVNVGPTDCSIALTTGGTAQNIIPAGAALPGFTIANIDTAAGSGEPVWMSFTTTAAASTIASYPLSAPTATTFAGLSSYTTPLGFGTNANVSVVAATTGHKISCTKW